MSATCTHCGFPMDTPERAHSFIHQLMESITEHRKLLPLLRKEEAYAEDVTAAAKRVIDECDRRQREGYKPEAPWLDLHVLRKVIADRRTGIGTQWRPAACTRECVTCTYVEGEPCPFCQVENK